MDSFPELENLLLYRGVKNFAVDLLTSAFGLYRDTVFIDWAIVEGTICLFTVRPGCEPTYHELEISEKDVTEWATSNLKAEYMRQPRANERMRALDGLIAPLGNLTKPGELLILSCRDSRGNTSPCPAVK
jgi:hypothetical protein